MDFETYSLLWCWRCGRLSATRATRGDDVDDADDNAGDGAAEVEADVNHDRRQNPPVAFAVAATMEMAATIDNTYMVLFIFSERALLSSS